MSVTQESKAKVIAITGASSGIGEATARALVANGYHVALLARREDKLNELVSELGEDKAYAVKADVSDFDTLSSAFADIHSKFGSIDGVFANAGTGVNSPGVAEGDVKEWSTMLGANVNGLLYTAKASLPYLKDSEGHFLLTSSAAGRMTLKGSVYGATKWFAYGFGMNLAEEMREWGGKCTTICPGMVNTPFFDEPKSDKLDPNDVAEAVLYAANANPRNTVREVYLMPSY